MSSGVKIDDEVKTAFNEMKSKSKYSYIIVALSEDKTKLLVESTGEPGDHYEEFCSKLKEAEDKNECRFAFYDFLYEKGGQNKSKLIFIHWNPDTAKMKPKMIYAASKSALTIALQDNTKFKQISDLSELDRDTVVKEVLKDDKV